MNSKKQCQVFGLSAMRKKYSIGKIKTSTEIKHLRKAAGIARDIFNTIVALIKPGITERGIASDLEACIRQKGLRRSFKTIVASGPNSAKPHAEVTDRKIKKNDIIVIDFGVIYKGYHSDMSRTVVVGKTTARMKKLYNTVKAAQELAIRNARSGKKISCLAKLAHDYMRKKGLGRYILHTLGHGLGQKIHEAPKLSEKNRGILRTNMVITIEPGLYIKGIGGVRIEDMVLIKTNGCEVLTK